MRSQSDSVLFMRGWLDVPWLVQDKTAYLHGVCDPLLALKYLGKNILLNGIRDTTQAMNYVNVNFLAAKMRCMAHYHAASNRAPVWHKEHER